MIAYFFIFILACLVVVAGIKIEDLKGRLNASVIRCGDMEVAYRERIGRLNLDLANSIRSHTIVVLDLKDLELEYLLLADKYHRGE